MTGAIAHRGPDDEQVHIEPGVALGRRRLSIVDLAGGRQPIANEDGSSLGRLQRRAVRVSRTARRNCSRGATGSRPAATPRRGSTSTRTCGEGMFEKARGQFAVSLWDRNEPDADPRPRPGRDLPALLRRARRLAALGLGDQGAAGLGDGAGPARPEGDRPPLHVLLRGDDADVLRGGQVAPAGPLTCRSRTAGSSSSSTGTSTSPTPATSAGWTTRPRWSTSSRALLRQAVERRLRGDVPVVSYISGGLDSTVVLGLSSRAARRGGAVVHDRARQGRARRAVAVDRGGRRCSARR